MAGGFLIKGRSMLNKDVIKDLGLKTICQISYRAVMFGLLCCPCLFLSYFVFPSLHVVCFGTV